MTTKKRLTTILAALVIALGLAVAVGPASPAQAAGCDQFFAPSAGHGLVQDNVGNWSYKSWTANYVKDSNHNSTCQDIQIRTYLRSGCTTPQDGGTSARVRLFLSGGNESAGPLYPIFCGSSTFVILAHNQPDGQWFRIEVDYPAGNDGAFNVQIMD